MSVPNELDSAALLEQALDQISKVQTQTLQLSQLLVLQQDHINAIETTLLGLKNASSSPQPMSGSKTSLPDTAARKAPNLSIQTSRPESQLPLGTAEQPSTPRMSTSKSDLSQLSEKLADQSSRFSSKETVNKLVGNKAVYTVPAPSTPPPMTAAVDIPEPSPTFSLLQQYSELYRTASNTSESVENIQVAVELGLIGKVPSGLKCPDGHDVAAIFSANIDHRLWSFAKTYAQLRAFDEKVRPCAVRLDEFLPHLPEKSLFNNATPINVDVRIDMLRAYFRALHTIISTKPTKEKAKSHHSILKACNAFYRSNIVDLPSADNHVGYLLTRARFGQWKVKYYCVNGNVLDVYDRPEGTRLDSILMERASVVKVEEPAIGTSDERHAFAITEHRGRKDRAIFCAESDTERNRWLAMLEVSTRAPPNQMAHKPLPERPYRWRHLGKAIGSPRSPVSQRLRRHSIDSVASSSCTDLSEEDLYRLGLGVELVKPIHTGSPGHSGSYSSHSPSHSGHTNGHAGGHTDHAGHVFGVRLSDALEFSARAVDGVKVPSIVARCLEVLDQQDAFYEEGIFRVSGLQASVDRIAQEFETNGDADLVETGADMHVCASLFKRYLRQLPDPLLVTAREEPVSQWLALDEQRRCAKVKQAVAQLPKENHDLLKVVIGALVKVTQNCAKNRMTLGNVGIVFAPTLHLPTCVLTSCIENHQEIFG